MRSIFRSDRPGFMRKTCFSPFKPYLQLRGTLPSNISMLWKCIHGKSATVAGRKTDKYISPRSKSFHYLLLLQQQLFITTFFLTATSEFVKRHNTNLCIGLVTKQLVWHNRTLQSDWRTLYRLRGTKRCMTVLPDPLSIFQKRSGHETSLMRSISSSNQPTLFLLSEYS